LQGDCSVATPRRPYAVAERARRSRERPTADAHTDEDDPMTDDKTETPTDAPDAPDASDVVEGPVGSASLRDPNTSGPMGADLDELPTLDGPGSGGSPSDDAPSDDDTSIHERQDPDHVGVDWDLTARNRD
jgi:hypothetical protein